MTISDADLAHYEEHGYAILPGFLSGESLERAQEAMFQVWPRPEAYFADPQAFPKLAQSQFSGIELFPYPSWDLNQVPCSDAFGDLARRVLGGDDVQIYKIELWAKYAGAVDYDQMLHRDFGNHTLVVPSEDLRYRQMTTFLLLSDVTKADAPTKVVPLEHTRDVPLGHRYLPGHKRWPEVEVSVTGAAGTLFIYRTDIYHRASGFQDQGRARFAMLTDFMRRGTAWFGKHAWPQQTGRPGWDEAMVRMTPRQRDLFGWPRPGDPYWTAQTLADVAIRYPGIDLTPYAA